MENIKTAECLPQVKVKKLKEASEKIQIVDVRSQEEFAERHIPSAVNLPLDGLEAAAAKLDKNTVFVTACGKGGGRSAIGAETLQKLGFRAFWLCGGTFGWLEEN